MIAALAMLALGPVDLIALTADCFDGDTCRLTIVMPSPMHVDMLAHKQPVRLCDIDAPELRGETLEAGRKSRDMLMAWIKDAKNVVFRLATGPDNRGLKDKWGRWLGWIIADGVNLNTKLVDEGLAVTFLPVCP